MKQYTKQNNIWIIMIVILYNHNYIDGALCIHNQSTKLETINTFKRNK